MTPRVIEWNWRQRPSIRIGSIGFLAAALVLGAAACGSGGGGAISSGTGTQSATSKPGPATQPATTGPAPQGTTNGRSPGPAAAPSETWVCSAPIWPQCQPPGSGALPAAQLMQIKPVMMGLSGDGTLNLIDIVWHDWGSGEAVGTGTYATNACIPNCASGPTRYEQGKVFLTDLVPYDGGQAYDDITLAAPADLQPAIGDHITGAIP